jgi:hypothetical protein
VTSLLATPSRAKVATHASMGGTLGRKPLRVGDGCNDQGKSERCSIVTLVTHV